MQGHSGRWLFAQLDPILGEQWESRRGQEAFPRSENDGQYSTQKAPPAITALRPTQLEPMGFTPKLRTPGQPTDHEDVYYTTWLSLSSEHLHRVRGREGDSLLSPTLFSCNCHCQFILIDAEEFVCVWGKAGDSKRVSQHTWLPNGNGRWEALITPWALSLGEQWKPGVPHQRLWGMARTLVSWGHGDQSCHVL